MSLSSLSCNLNDVVCIDHFYLGNITLLHVMDTATRYSDVYVVSSTVLDEAVLGFEVCWLSQFWPPSAIHAEMRFVRVNFVKY